MAALLIAEGAVLVLRPAQDLDPVPVSASSLFRPAELERARDYAGGQRLLGLGAIAAQAGVLVLLVAASSAPRGGAGSSAPRGGARRRRRRSREAA